MMKDHEMKDHVHAHRLTHRLDRTMRWLIPVIMLSAGLILILSINQAISGFLIKNSPKAQEVEQKARPTPEKEMTP